MGNLHCFVCAAMNCVNFFTAFVDLVLALLNTLEDGADERAGPGKDQQTETGHKNSASSARKLQRRLEKLPNLLISFVENVAQCVNLRIQSIQSLLRHLPSCSVAREYFSCLSVCLSVDV